MPSGYFGAWFLHKLLKGRSAAEVERGFWVLIAWIVGVFAWIWIAMALRWPADLTLVSIPVITVALLAWQGWRRH